MFKWIKQLFKVDKGYYAGLPFAEGRSESLPCASMQSEIIANELEEKEHSFSEPVNLIVESLGEEGRWTWKFVDNNINYKKHHKILDNKTGFTVEVYRTSFSTGAHYYADCNWATHKESCYMGKQMIHMINTHKDKIEKENKEKARAEVMALYKKVSNAE